MHPIVLGAALCCVLSGHVRSGEGLPIANALIDVSGPQQAHAQSDRSGAFRLRVLPGRYDVTASARGYVTTSAGPLLVDRDANVEIALEPIDTPQLRVIGHVTVNGQLAPSHAPIPVVDITRAQMEQSGGDRVVESLTQVPSLTFARPDGGSSTAPYLVALRGPDPSETLIALDGQILNDANTGDVDLARFPIAAFSSAAVSEGLGTSDTEASNTIGGAVNLISLRPTKEAHSAYSFSAGSFGSSEGWLNSTGTEGRFGYAFAADDQQEHGYVDQNVRLQRSCPPPNDALTCAVPTHLGSTVSSRTFLTNMQWTFSQNADVGARIFVLTNNRDESGALNTPTNVNDENAGALFSGPGPATFAQTIRAYDLHGRSPLGAGSLLYEASASNNDVTFAGAGVTPYDVTHRDKRATYSLAWDRTSAEGEITFGGFLRTESLSESGVAGEPRQTIQGYFARGAIKPTRRLHLQAAAYLAQYSTFGSSLDGRIGGSYDLSANDVLRASAGSGFRAPLLIERYVFPVSSLPRDVNCVAVGQGNPKLKPEHASEYEVGFAHRFDLQTTIDVALYRTNLRDPIEHFYPLGATCPPDTPPLQSFPINVGNVVYQGAEVRFAHRFPHVLVQANYGLNLAYPFNLPSTVSNPTSGGDLVTNQQFLNIPQQQASFAAAWENHDWHAAIDGYYRGRNNELNQGPFAVLGGAVGHRFKALNVTVAGTNLTNAVAGKFTLPGLGIPYRGIVAEHSDGAPVLGNLPTDLLFVEPAGVRVILTLRE